MKYENVKSLILTILVLMSLWLTWNLWTYQPEREFVNNEGVISDVEISQKLERNQLVKPNLILYHYEEEHHGAMDSSHITRFLDEFKNWSLYDIELMNSASHRDFTSFLHGNRKMEVVFPAEIPLNTFRFMTNFSESDPPSVPISRIVIDFNNQIEGIDPSIYLVNYAEEEVYRAKVSSLSLYELERSFYQTGRTFPSYLAVPAEEDRYLFLPALANEEEQRHRKYHYFTDQLNPELFKDALFSNPNIVAKDQTIDGEIYRDDSSLMRVHAQDSKLQYVNPGNSSGSGNSMDFNVIERGIDFVNDHAGWTGPVENYRLDRWNRLSLGHTVHFRMYLGDLPIFNFDPDGTAEIKQIWNNNEIYEYERPTFEFGVLVTQESKQLPSGNRVMQELNRLKVDLSNVSNIRIGYELRKDPSQEKIFILDPVWLYQEGNFWTKINITDNDDLEGGV
ncbi:YycH family regulatory protein [Sutcliffiella rhizosphaerae]|uniref:Two-component system WalR/WalK regulatory protein YycH n=1 Tax=Sutcliffiella rhizosphaerae TaxID=2880967 RepID=A0ABM8YSC1_9BACI|nr:two-component system activity regulator YycH [Sutcliffiella rhizosphaerae]CAG9622906.1 Two-component system WalR/WalK regulatory protein YycH [Sutcliffiella rhizosphaerae]